MRTALVLWWVVIALGVSTYYVWYIASVPKIVAVEIQTPPPKPKEEAVTLEPAGGVPQPTGEMYLISAS